MKPPRHKDNRGRRNPIWPDIPISRLAEQVGISASHLVNIMAGRSKPSIEVAIALAGHWSRLTGKQVTVEGLSKQFRKAKQQGQKQKQKKGAV